MSLNNVENTKLSTWTGSTAITTLGTISTGTIPWANISGKPSQATTWPNWGQILQSGANNIEEGTSDFTDNTEIFSSYASNNGFADTNASGKVYRRDAIKLYNYIKGKTDSLYATVGHNHDSTYVNVGGDTMTGALQIKNPSDFSSVAYSGGGFHAGYVNLVLHGGETGSSGIVFCSHKNDTNINAPSDRGFIQFHSYGITTTTAEGTAPTLATSGEKNRLVIGVGNDADDQVWLQTPSVNGLIHQTGTTSYVIPSLSATTTTANHPLISTTTAGLYANNTSITMDGGTITATTFSGSLTGNASTASSLANFKVTTTANLWAVDSPTTNAIGYQSGLTKAAWNYQQTDGATYVQWYNANWVHEIFGDYRTGQISVRGKNSGTWQAWRRILDETNGASILGLKALAYKDSLTKSDVGLGNVSNQTITVTSTSVSDGTNTFSKYTLPTASTSTKGGIKVGSGLTMSSETLNHSNSVTAKTAAAQSAKTLAWGGTFTLYEEKYDAQGHVTGVASYNMTMPANPNTDKSVLQTLTNSNHWRKVLVGYQYDANPNVAVTNQTNQVYASPNLEFKSQSGTLKATEYSVNGNVTLEYNSTTESLDFVF